MSNKINENTTLLEDVSQPEEVFKEEIKATENGYAERNEGSKTTMSTADWTRQSSRLGKLPDTSNYNLNTNTKDGGNIDDYTRQWTHLSMQAALESGAYLKSGYNDMRAAYYGWLPGINPMRFPAFIYPQSFLGFAPTVAWMKTDDGAGLPAAHMKKIEKWKESSRSERSSREVCHSVYDNSFHAGKLGKDSAKSSMSDEDEGLVLDDREMRRRREKELQAQTLKMSSQTGQERGSVIQENISIQAKPSVISSTQNVTTNADQNVKPPAKRGRASTRQIEKTEQYWDRRKKNNVSAKKSRDARRQREALTNQRSAMLETENLRLRAELATLRDENTRLKQELNNLKTSAS